MDAFVRVSDEDEKAEDVPERTATNYDRWYKD